MNKKITVIELLNKIANGEEVPKKIKWGTVNYILKQDRLDGHLYYEKEQGCASLVSELKTMNDLKSEVEILEDNTVEIEEIKGWGLATDNKDYETINHTLDRFGEKINELVKAVNEMRKELNK